MGFWDKLKGEFIDVIEWVDDSPDTLVYRFPTRNREIQMGSSLIVRETQRAMFVYQGESADLFGPGHYKLTTDNMPVMTTLAHWTHGFNTPFKSEVYYFNTRQFTDLRWGTPRPVTVRDSDFGVARLRAFGIYSMRIDDPKRFFTEISATKERFRVGDIEDQLRQTVITRISDLFGEAEHPFLDYAANLNEFSAAMEQALKPDFAKFGLGLASFFIQNVSLPPEVEKALDARARMAAIGDLDAYTKLQTADAIPEAAKQEGGLAGAGLGAGIGIAMGQGIGAALGGQQGGSGQPQQSQQPASPDQSAETKIMVRCMKCGKLSEETAKFCSGCGNQLRSD
jgi:membrane protease subunit (stomatin/prohibitin family)